MSILLKTNSIDEAKLLLSVNTILPTTFVDDNYWHERALLSSHQLSATQVKSLSDSDSKGVLVSYEIRYQGPHSNWLWRNESQLLLTSDDFALWSKLAEGEGVKNLTYTETKLKQLIAVRYLQCPTYNINGYKGELVNSYSAQIESIENQRYSDYEASNKQTAFGNLMNNDKGESIMIPWSSIHVRDINRAGV